MDFGFTNDESRIPEIRAWIAAAVADGWSHTTYFDSEPIESACRLAKDGFQVSILTRTLKPGGRWKYEAKASMWGPDGLVCGKPGTVYDWEQIKTLPRTCNYCHAKDVDVQRIGFAGRCCEACLPKERARAERPGWKN